MDTKLDTGRLVLILLFLAIGCSTSKTDQKELYLDEYKITYYRSCLKHGFNSSKTINNILNLDKSSYGEPILGKNYIVIDSLAQVTASKITQDSVALQGKVPNEVLGKKVLKKCLCEYNSKWLDKLAKQSFQRQKDMSNAN